MKRNNLIPDFKLLDVTLRDGGYRNNFSINQGYARHLVKNLSEAKVDYIEVGYRNGLAKKSQTLGPTGQCPNSYIADLREHCPQAQIGVMVHPQNVGAEDLHHLKELGVSLIRVCLTAPTMEENIRTINACKSFGFTTTANIIKVSTRSLAEVLDTVGMLNESQADVIYIADSFGNLIPEVVSEYFQALSVATSKKLGFHAHNNLSLALSNTLAAIENGAKFIDASVCGMGFGTGNLAMEVLAGYLERIGKGERVNVRKIFELATWFSNEVPKSHFPPQAMDIFWGLNNLSSHFKKPVLEIAEEENLSVFEVSQLVANNEGLCPQRSEILELLHASLALPSAP